MACPSLTARPPQLVLASGQSSVARLEMKVAYILDQFPRVSETFISDEIHSIARAGVIAHVFALGRPPSEPLNDRAQAVVRTCGVTYCGEQPTPRALAVLKLLGRRPALTLRTLFLALKSQDRWLARMAIGIAVAVERGRFTRLHVHYADKAAQVAMWVHRWTGIPFTFTTHRYDIFESPPNNIAELHSESSGMVCISRFNLEHVERAFQLDRAKLTVVHCGIYVSDFLESPHAPSGVYMNGRKLSLLCVGRLNPEKGHKYLLHAMADLRTSDLPFQLKLVGDGPLRGDLEALASELGIEDSVSFLGAKSTADVRQLLSSTDIAILASLSEGIPIALMEAMASGRPVIATRVAGVPELVADKVTGFLCAPGNSKEVADTVRWVVAHPEETRAIAAAGQRRVSEEFNRDACTEKLLALWQGT